MKELPFDPYDFFGYIASGVVLVAVAQLTFGFPRVIGVDLKPFDAAITILAVYVAGQLVAGPAKALLEDGLVHKLLGSPTRNLLRSNAPRLGKLLFPGFYKSLPSTVQSKLLSNLDAMQPAPRESEAIFLAVRYCPAVLDDEKLMTKIDKFRDLYGFNRNISFSLMVAAVVFFAVGWSQHRTELTQYGIAATVTGVLLLYRFLKFYRQYSYELLNCYACKDERGSR